MVRTKRNAALKAQASVTSFTKKTNDDEDFVVPRKRKEKVEELDSFSSPGASSSEPEELSEATESEESAEEAEESEDGTSKPQIKRGRPRKNDTGRVKKKYPTGNKYIPLTVYHPLGVGPFTYSSTNGYRLLPLITI